MNNNQINFCSNCGTQNTVGASFCIGCGNSIQNMGVNNNYQSTVQQSMVNQQQVSQNQSISTKKSEKMNYFKYLLFSFLKPHSEYKKEEKKLEDIKNSGVLSGIIIGALLIIKLFTTMLNTVRQKNLWTGEVTWVWDNLKNVEYFKLLGKSLLIYVGIFVAVTLVYFLASLIIKKDVKFPKVLGITVTALLPMFVCSSILSPILTLIEFRVGLCVTVIGFIYTLIILIELVNDTINFEKKDIKIYFHLACLSILLVVALLVVYNSIFGSLGSLLG